MTNLNLLYTVRALETAIDLMHSAYSLRRDSDFEAPVGIVACAKEMIKSINYAADEIEDELATQRAA